MIIKQEKRERLESALRSVSEGLENEYTKQFGFNHDNIEGIPETFKDAISWFELKALSGDPVSQYIIGYCYYYGIELSESIDVALEWYRKAAEQGHARAQCELGFHYNRTFDLDDIYESIVWYKKAASQGCAEAQYWLAVEYESGNTLPQSMETAAKLIKKAANQGCKYAQSKLGFYYDCGFGVPQSHREAIKWFKRAAEQGDSDAKRWLNADRGNPEDQYVIALKYD